MAAGHSFLFLMLYVSMRIFLVGMGDCRFAGILIYDISKGLYAGDDVKTGFLGGTSV